MIGGAKFEILVDGETKGYRDTMLRALGAATILKSQNPSCEVAVRDLETGRLTEVTNWQ